MATTLNPNILVCNQPLPTALSNNLLKIIKLLRILKIVCFLYYSYIQILSLWNTAPPHTIKQAGVSKCPVICLLTIHIGLQHLGLLGKVLSLERVRGLKNVFISFLTFKVYGKIFAHWEGSGRWKFYFLVINVCVDTYYSNLFINKVGTISMETNNSKTKNLSIFSAFSSLGRT